MSSGNEFEVGENSTANFTFQEAGRAKVGTPIMMIEGAFPCKVT